MRIDAHQHFWRYAAREYGWIDSRMGRIARDFMPADLAPELDALGLDGCIAVQARASAAESDFLLALAREHAFVKGVVGWVDLCSPAVERELERLAAEPRFRGVRHPVQDEPDERFLLRPDFLRGMRALARFELVYELLVHPRHLEVVRRFAAQFPGQALVLDHLAKPAIARGERDPWERQIRALAELPHVSCKLSGLVTEARWNAWRAADFRFYLDVALDAFGEERLLFGSDWPVCLVAAHDYEQVFELVADWSAQLTPAARSKLFGGNAARIYHLAPGDA